MVGSSASDFHGRITGQEYRVDLNTSEQWIGKYLLHLRAQL